MRASTALCGLCVAASLDAVHGQSLSVSSSGSGFFVAGDGKVLTNNHVIDECSAIKIERPGFEAINAFVAARDKSNDLALLRASIKPATVPGFRSYIRLGESVSVFGFPVPPVLASSGNFTVGTVTALAGPHDDSSLLQISAPVQPGNSGGPLIDKYGNIAGVIVGKIDALQNVNFAIKSSIATNFLSSNRVTPNEGAISHELPTEEIADLANAFSVRVLCYQTAPPRRDGLAVGGPYVPAPEEPSTA